MKTEAWSGVLVFLFGAVTTYLSLQMDAGTFRMAGPGLFPLCLGLLLMVLSSVFVLKSLTGARPQPGGEDVLRKAGGGMKPVLMFLGAIVVTILLFRPLGYPLAAFLLLILLLQILGVKPWYRSALLSFITAGVSYWLFVRWLMIPLPRGWLGL